MTSLVRCLLLLYAVALLEVASTRKLQIAPRVEPIKNDIDYEKCFATRKGRNQYMCVMLASYKAAASDKPTPCNYDKLDIQLYDNERATVKDLDERCKQSGFTFRPLSPTSWDIEVKARKEGTSIEPFYLTLKFDDQGITQHETTIAKFINKLGTNGERELSMEFVTRNPGDPPSYTPTIPQDDRFSAINNVDFFEENEHYQYFRFELNYKGTPAPGKRFSLVSVKGTLGDTAASKALRRLVKDGLIDDANLLSPCKDIANIIERRSPDWHAYRTKMPFRNYDRGVHDFSTMCPKNYKPTYKGKEVISIECLHIGKTVKADNLDLPTYLPHLVYIDGKEVAFEETTNTQSMGQRFYNYVDFITCQTMEEDCYYCGGSNGNEAPDWLTAPPPEGLALMKIVPGVPARPGSPTKCPRLTCENGQLPFYPQTNFISHEEPQCVYNREKETFEWTITVRDWNKWDRERVPLDKGYCWKTEMKPSACAPFPPSVLACPKTKLPGFKHCASPTYDDFMKGFECREPLMLHIAFTKRIDVTAPVESVVCDEKRGEFVATMFNGEKLARLTDDSWIVCKKLRRAPKAETSVSPERHPLLRAFIASLLAILAFAAVIGVIVLLRYPMVLYWDSIYITQMDNEIMAARHARYKEDEEAKRGIAGLPAANGDAPTLRPGKANVASSPEFVEHYTPKKSKESADSKAVTPSASSVKKRRPLADRPKLSAKRVFGRDELTCLEPDAEELEMLQECDRLAKCVRDKKRVEEVDDNTGKEIRSIRKDDLEEKKEEPVKKDGDKAVDEPVEVTAQSGPAVVAQSEASDKKKK